MAKLKTLRVVGRPAMASAIMRLIIAKKFKRKVLIGSK